jgi:hypothetical protein
MQAADLQWFAWISGPSMHCIHMTVVIDLPGRSSLRFNTRTISLWGYPSTPVNQQKHDIFRRLVPTFGRQVQPHLPSHAA